MCPSTHLWPDAEEAAAVWCATFTDRFPVPQTLQVVVESELCSWTHTHTHNWKEAATLEHTHFSWTNSYCWSLVFSKQRTCSDVNESEQSHPGVSAHRPLLRLTVRLTAVVHEASLVPLRPGIDDSILTHKLSPIRNSGGSTCAQLSLIPIW